MIAGALGVWLFYVQHSFEDGYWDARRASGIRVAPRSTAARSTTCRAVLRWITCNIGYHHIHHLAPRIPNYHLRAAHEATALENVRRMDAARQLRLRAHEALGRGPGPDGGFSAPRGWHLMVRELPYAVTHRDQRGLRRDPPVDRNTHILIIERRSAHQHGARPSCCRPRLRRGTRRAQRGACNSHRRSVLPRNRVSRHRASRQRKPRSGGTAVPPRKPKCHAPDRTDRLWRSMSAGRGASRGLRALPGQAGDAGGARQGLAAPQRKQRPSGASRIPARPRARQPRCPNPQTPVQAQAAAAAGAAAGRGMRTVSPSSPRSSGTSPRRMLDSISRSTLGE